MSLFQIFNAFEKYSFDVLFLALIVVIITSFIKRIILKNKYKKIVTFIPFFVGIAVYILYLYVFFNKNIKILITTENIKNGFITGGLSTVYYVFYEQFIRGKRDIATFNITELTIEGILSSIVIKNYLESTAKVIAEKTADRLNDKSYCCNIITETVNGKLISGISPSDVLLNAKLIISALNSLK
jgi:hypothetical protein